MRCKECGNYGGDCDCYTYPINQGPETFDDESGCHTDGNDYCKDCGQLEKGYAIDPNCQVCKCVNRDDPRYIDLQYSTSDEEAIELGCRFRAYQNEMSWGGWLGENENDFLDAIYDDMKFSLIIEEMENWDKDLTIYELKE
jgi:hypothetical protein